MRIKLYLSAVKLMIYTRGVQTVARDVLIKTKFEVNWKTRPPFFFFFSFLEGQVKNPREIHNKNQ